MPGLDLVIAAQCAFPTIFGSFELRLYQRRLDEGDMVVLSMGDISRQESVLVRLHSECLTGDALGSARCDCRHQLSVSMQIIAAEGAGVLIYLRQEGRGIGLPDKLRAYGLQDQGHDTVDANLLLGRKVDERDYGVAAAILGALGVHGVRLITNNTDKLNALIEAGIDVREIVSVAPRVTVHNLRYLRTKRDRLKHSLDLDSFSHPEQGPDENFAMNPGSSRPRITLAYAQTLDGSITLRKRESLTISSLSSRTLTHQLRSLHDGILVGIGTILADDPTLNVRYVVGSDPRPIVLDSNLRIPPDAKVLQSAASPIIVCAEDAAPERATQLEDMGASVVRSARDQNGLLSLDEVLHYLRHMGLERVMVEGGQAIISNFLANRLVDECVITIAPRFVGGVSAIGMLLSSPFPELENVSIEVLGGDLVVRGTLQSN